MIHKLQLFPIRKSISQKMVNQPKDVYSYSSIYTEPVDLCYIKQDEKFSVNLKGEDKENLKDFNQSDSFLCLYRNNKRGGTAKICLHSKDKYNLVNENSQKFF